MLLAAAVCAGSLTMCMADDPKPDPAGIMTGDKTHALDAGGNPFVVTEPTDKKDPDYAAKRKAFDEFQSQAAKEPLAVKLADSVGHVRVATNFGWTLNTGYLVLLMQAGFALLTCGLVRKKCGSPDDAEFRRVRFRLPRLLCRGVCLPVWSCRGECCTH
jgi:Amt family ammonium transporter